MFTVQALRVGVCLARSILWMFQNACHHRYARIPEFRTSLFSLGVLVPSFHLIDYTAALGWPRWPCSTRTLFLVRW